MGQDQTDDGTDQTAKQESNVERKWRQVLADAAPPVPTMTMEEAKKMVRLNIDDTTINWVKWEAAGQVVEGVLIKHERDVQGQFSKRQDLIKLRNGKTVYGIRCPTKLQQMIRDNEQMIQIGKTWLRIVFTGKETYGDGTRAKYGFELYMSE